jgi:hypothetical protein
MPAPATVLFNGVNYSWLNAAIIIFNVPLIGITKISIKEKQVKDNNYGYGSQPTSRGYGNVEYEASMSVYADELFKWVNATSDGKILNIPMFDFPMVLSGSRVVPQKVIVRAAEFLESPFETNQGDSKIIIDLPLVIGGVDWKS